MYMLRKALSPLAASGVLRRRRVLPARARPPTTALVIQDIRYFSISTPRNAEEDNARVLDALAKSPDFTKVMETPSIVEAMTSLVQIAQEEGIDINIRPSMPTMFKMATNPRIKAAILKVQQQCEAAGINLTKSNAFEIFNNLQRGER